MNIYKHVYKFIQCETHGYNVKDETSIVIPVLIFGVGIIMTIKFISMCTNLYHVKHMDTM